MSISRKNLVTEFAAAIQSGEAALFAGAGLSRPSGFVDWKNLLRGCADEIGLDLDKETDFVSVAQYYLNSRAGNRWRLNQTLLQEFDRQSTLTPNHQIISRLPIPTVWTTNFDTLLEQAFKNAGRRVNVKSEDAGIASSTRPGDVTLYKMHGDIARPNEIVISKADYERYVHDHPIFQTTLEMDLVARTFLFLGFSFADAHLNYMLGHLHALLHGNRRSHFAIMRRVRQNLARGEDGKRQFDYDRNRQDLQIKELERYNIQTHLVDRYSEITDILTAIEEAANSSNVFVSGSTNRYEPEFGEDRMRDLCMHLGEMLMEQNCKLISGFGLNIGDSVIKGALLKLYERKDSSIEQHFMLRPFPRNLPTHVSEADFLDKYRHNMISHCGFAIFISGASRSSPISAGVLDEYRISRRLNKTPIPIGATGFAAHEIWREVREDVDRCYRGAVSTTLFDRLGDRSLSNDELLRTVFEIMNRVSAAGLIARDVRVAGALH